MYRNRCQQQDANSCFTFVKNRLFNLKPKSKMTSVKARLNRSRLGNDGMYPLVIQVIRNRKKREIYTPYRLKAAEFNPKSETAIPVNHTKNRIAKIREINDFLINIKEEFRKIEELLASHGNYTAEDVIRSFKTRNDFSNFFVYAFNKIDELDSAGKNGTAANYYSAVNAFERFIGNRELPFADITQKTIEAFIDFQTQQGNSPNTVTFYVKQLRAIYNKADDEGFIHSIYNPFQKVKLKNCKTPKRAISRKEITKIVEFNSEGKHKHLELARNLFLLSLYTRGMSFVDMCYLKQENIKGNMLVYYRRKTGQFLQIKIEPALRTLLRKYSDDNSVYLLPMLRKDDSYKGYRYIQRRLNKRIRQIGDMLGFDFPLTFYVARHSWATLAHEKGIPVSVISESMRHTSEKTTRIYLANLSHQIIDKANRTVMNYWKMQ